MKQDFYLKVNSKYEVRLPDEIVNEFKESIFFIIFPDGSVWLHTKDYLEKLSSVLMQLKYKERLKIQRGFFARATEVKINGGKVVLPSSLKNLANKEIVLYKTDERIELFDRQVYEEKIKNEADIKPHIH